MKKLLLIISMLFAVTTLKSQVLQTEDFNILTTGNVGTVITGATAGQGSLLTFASNGAVPTTSNNAANALFQIVSTGNASNGLALSGPNGDKGNTFTWKNGLPAAWATRTAGNNIIEVEVDVFVPSGSTSVNRHGIRIFDAAGTKTLAGFQIIASTRELQAVVYSTPTGNPVNNYSYPLIAAPGVILPANTWSRIGISYNKTTNEYKIKGPGVPANITVMGSAASLDPDEVDFLVTSGHTLALPNTTSGTITFDNLTVKATGVDTLLSTDSVEFADNKFSTYPNPVKNIISISNSENINVKSVSISDLNGRVIKTENFSNVSDIKVNVSDLSSGMYLMNINSDQGVVTKKIVKE